MPRVLLLADRIFKDARGDEESHPGGAELTDAAAIEACPWPIELARIAEFDPSRLDEFDLHLLGNMEQATPSLVEALSRRRRHVLFEHDVRICRWRGNFTSSISVAHRGAQWCTCRHPQFSLLYRTAIGAIFLTHRQLDVYLHNPFFRCPRSAVLGSSLMNRAFFERVKLSRSRAGGRGAETVVVYSPNRIKGFERSQRWCREHGIRPRVLRNLEPDRILDAFERSARLVYLPEGLEPAGRLLVEARFLGSEVVTNANAGVCGESWWQLEDELALRVLADAPARFWRIVEHLLAQERTEMPGAPLAVGAITTALRAADRRRAIETFPKR